MAGIETSIKLHDKVSSTLRNVEKRVDKFLTTLSKFDNTEINLDDKFAKSGKELFKLIGQLEDLQKKMYEVAQQPIKIKQAAVDLETKGIKRDIAKEAKAQAIEGTKQERTKTAIWDNNLAISGEKVKQAFSATETAANNASKSGVLLQTALTNSQIAGEKLTQSVAGTDKAIVGAQKAQLMLNQSTNQYLEKLRQAGVSEDEIQQNLQQIQSLNQQILTTTGQKKAQIQEELNAYQGVIDCVREMDEEELKHIILLNQGEKSVYDLLRTQEQLTGEKYNTAISEQKLQQEIGKTAIVEEGVKQSVINTATAEEKLATATYNTERAQEGVRTQVERTNNAKLRGVEIQQRTADAHSRSENSKVNATRKANAQIANSNAKTQNAIEVKNRESATKTNSIWQRTTNFIQQRWAMTNARLKVEDQKRVNSYNESQNRIANKTRETNARIEREAARHNQKMSADAQYQNQRQLLMQQRIRGQIIRNANAQRGFNATLAGGVGGAAALLSKIKGFAGAYLGFQAVTNVAGSLIKTSDSITQIRNKMNLLTSSATETEGVMNKVYYASLRSRGGYAQMADAVTKIGVRAGNAFDNNIDQIIAFTETFNKMGVVSGASTEEMNAALLQITQALGVGVLRGDEFRSVSEHIPLIIQAIGKEMGVTTEKVKSLADDGKISADILKRAMLNAAIEMDGKVKKMQYTWGQVWQLIQNFALKVFDPLLKAISKVTQSEKFIEFCTLVGNAMKKLAPIATFVFNKIGEIIGFIWSKFKGLIPYLRQGFNIIKTIGSAIYENFVPTWKEVESTLSDVWQKFVDLYEYIKTNWSKIAPIFWGIIAALVVYKIVVLAISAATAIWAVVSAALFWKVTLIALAVVALIFVFYKVIDVVNDWLGTSISATGLIMGAIASLVSYIWNKIALIWNILMSVIEWFVNVWDHPEYACKMFFLNLAKIGQEWCIAMSGFAQDVADAIVDAVGWAVNKCIDLINWLIDCLPSKAQDFLGVKGSISHVEWEAPNLKNQYQKNLDEINKMISELEKPEDYWEAPKAGFLDQKETAKEWYEIGKGLEEYAKNFDGKKFGEQFGLNKVEELLKKGADTTTAGGNDITKALGNNLDGIDKALNDINKNTGNIAGSSADTAKNTSKEEDFTWVRDMAIRNAINEYSTHNMNTWKVTNNNNITKGADYKEILAAMCEDLSKTNSFGRKGVPVY